MTTPDTITTGGRTIPLPTEADLAMNLAEEWRASTDHIAAGFSGAPWNYVCGFIRRCHAAEAEVRRQAEEIASLRERVAELEAGLRPFADASASLDMYSVWSRGGSVPLVSDYRRAAALLAKGTLAATEMGTTSIRPVFPIQPEDMP